MIRPADHVRLAPESDVETQSRNVRFVPNSEILRLAARRIVAKFAHSSAQHFVIVDHVDFAKPESL